MAGRQDGKALGIQKGFEVGHEIGYYAGCVHIWRQLGDKNKNSNSTRVEKAINALEDLLRSFPLGSPSVSSIIFIEEYFIHVFLYIFSIYKTKRSDCSQWRISSVNSLQN